MITKHRLLLFFYFTIFSLTSIIAQREVIISTSTGDCTIRFADAIFESEEEVITVTNSQFESIDDGVDIICNEENCENQIMEEDGWTTCPADYTPICGCDNKAYTSTCGRRLSMQINAYRKVPTDITLNDGYCFWSATNNNPVGVVGNSNRRRRNRGRKLSRSEFEDDLPNVSTCHTLFRWEWYFTDYDEETLEILKIDTIFKNFRIQDTEPPKIRLLPNPNGNIPIAVAIDNTKAEITAFSEDLFFYYWQAKDACNNQTEVLLEKSNAPKKNWYADFDNDSFGDPNTMIQWGIKPFNYVENALDCDDTNFFINPYALEDASNHIDENCDGDYGQTNCFWFYQRTKGIKGNGYYAAEDELKSDMKIPSGVTTIFNSGRKVTLLPGFIAQAGSEVTIQIKECDPRTTSARNLESLKIQNKTTPTLQKLGFKVFPNPTIINNRVQLSFNLPKKDLISVQLYNSYSIKIKDIINTKAYAAGKHQLSLNTQDFSKGMYILRIQTKEEQLSKKLLLID